MSFSRLNRHSRTSSPNRRNFRQIAYTYITRCICSSGLISHTSARQSTNYKNIAKKLAIHRYALFKRIIVMNVSPPIPAFRLCTRLNTFQLQFSQLIRADVSTDRKPIYHFVYFFFTFLSSSKRTQLRANKIIQKFVRFGGSFFISKFPPRRPHTR